MHHAFSSLNVRKPDAYDLLRLADRWELSLADTMHLMIAANVRALGWTVTREAPIVHRRGKRTGRRPNRPPSPADWIDPGPLRTQRQPFPDPFTRP